MHTYLKICIDSNHTNLPSCCFFNDDFDVVIFVVVVDPGYLPLKADQYQVSYTSDDSVVFARLSPKLANT